MEVNEDHFLDLHKDVAVLKNQIEEVTKSIQDLKGQLSDTVDIIVDIKSMMDKSRGFAVAVIVVISCIAWILDGWHSIKESLVRFFS